MYFVKYQPYWKICQIKLHTLRTAMQPTHTIARQLRADTSGGSSAEWVNGGEVGAGGRTGAAPSSVKQRRSSCANNKIRSYASNFVTAKKLEVGFQNPRRRLTRPWEKYPKCLFAYLQYCWEMKTKQTIWKNNLNTKQANFNFPPHPQISSDELQSSPSSVPV
jgi:hypothetical protein